MADLSDLMSMASDPKAQQTGLQMLMSGDPKFTSQVQSVMSHPAFAQAIAGGQAPPSNAFQSAIAGQPPVAPAPKKQTKVESKKETTSKDTVTHNNFLSGDQFKNNTDIVGATPEVASERDAIKASEDRLNMQRQQLPESDGAWIRPFAAYVDSTQGTKLSAAANAMPTNADRLAGINTAQDALTKRKNDLGKLIIDGTKQMKDGTTSNQMSNMQQQLNSLIQGDQMGGAMGMANARLAPIPIRAGQDFDKQTANATKSVESFNRGDRILNDATIPLTDQGLHMIQQDISNGLSGSGQATDAKIAMDMQENIKGIIQKAKAKYGDFKPGDDLRTKIPGIVGQINKVLQATRQEYADNINRQADQIAKTYEGSYAAIPNLQTTVEAKRQALSDRFPKSEGYSKTGGFVTPSGDIKVVNAKGEAHIIHAGPKQKQDIADAAAAGYKAAP